MLKKHYKIEPHLHTSESSLCGLVSAVDFVELYHKHGYNGIFVTDHLHEEFVLSQNYQHDWNACIDRFLAGYNKAKEHGGKIGLNVMLGAEIGFNEPKGTDYLIYDFDECFLRNNPFMHRLSPKEFFKRFGAEILIINAHPCRNGNEEVYVDCVHGIEVFNSVPRHINFNEKALELSEANPMLYRFAGSDAHHKGDEFGAWMLFMGPISNAREFHEAVKRNDYSLGHK